MAVALACSKSAGSSSWSRLRCQRRRASPATSSPRTDATWSTRSRFLTGTPSLARVPGYAAPRVRKQPGGGQTGRMTQPGAPDVVVLERWTGPILDGDPHANFKRDVATGSLVDPLPTLTNLADFVGLPLGAVVRHALVKWTTAGSDALLEVGPGWVRRLGEPVARAETAGTDEARLVAYEELRGLLGWLAAGVDEGPFETENDGRNDG